MTTRLLPHTADLGLEVAADSLRGLFAEFAVSLVGWMVEGKVETQERRDVSLAALDRDALLVCFLNEVIYLFDEERFLTGGVRWLSLGNKNLRACALGEPYAPARHRLTHSCKAATYHQLTLERAGRRWRGRVIFDL